MITNYSKYLAELKNRLILVVLAWSFSLSVCYTYRELLLFGLINSNFIFSNLTPKPYFIFTNITEVFYVYIEVTFFIANQIGASVFMYQLLLFLSLGLYQVEIKRLSFFFRIVMLSWILSIVILYNVLIPFSWEFFLSFQNNASRLRPIDFFFEAKAIEYIHSFIDLYYICLLSCQFMTFLVVGLTSLNEKFKKTKEFRKLFYLVFVVFSTLISPPDILSQIVISVGLISIYECVILYNEIKSSMVTS